MTTTPRTRSVVERDVDRPAITEREPRTARTPTAIRGGIDIPIEPSPMSLTETQLKFP